MLGLAKDLFKQSAVSLDEFAVSIKGRQWPRIQRWIEKGCFSFVDYSFARAAWNADDPFDEEVALFLCYLMASSRQGHVCVTIDNGQLTPDLSIYSQTSNADEWDALKAAVLQGSEHVPAIILDHQGGKENLKPIVREGAHFYLQRNYQYETEVFHHVRRLIHTVEQQPVFHDAALTAEQAACLSKALQSSFFLLAGGPGTGKSFTAAAIVRASGCKRVFVAAPTGKAAAHLKAKLDPATESGTLHHLLKIKRPEDIRRRERYLPYDLIVIDEASMIDLPLFAALVAAIEPATRLILMGDPEQLPPVEAGCVFRDLCLFAKAHYSAIYGELTQCHRSDMRGVLDVSDSIKRRDVNDFFLALKYPQGAGATYCTSLKDDEIVGRAEAHFPLPQSAEPDPAILFTTGAAFRILSPVKLGPWGVQTLNQLIWKHFLTKVKHHKYWPIPIIIAKTSYPIELYNGETGFLVRSLKMPHQDFALFIDKSGTGYRRLPVTILPPYEQAYALTVHKAQGSEYDHILFFAPPGSEPFGQELLYTAATRARKTLTVVGDEEVLKQCLQAPNAKHSVLGHRLQAGIFSPLQT